MKITKFAAAALIVPASLCLANDPDMIEAKSGTTTVEAKIQVASASITDSGFVLSKNAVLNPEISVTTDELGPLPLSFGVWANYDIDKGRKNGASKNSAFTEVDIWVGTEFAFTETCGLELALISWQYPNMDLNHEELLFLNLYTECCDYLTFGVEYEYMLIGDSRKDMALKPYAKFGMTIVEEYGLGLELGVKPVFVIQDSGPDAWTACVLSAQVNCGPVYAFAKYYAQMSDKIYSDEMHKRANSVFGIGYKIEL